MFHGGWRGAQFYFVKDRFAVILGAVKQIVEPAKK